MRGRICFIRKGVAMLTVAICEDEPYFASHLTKLVTEYGDIRNWKLSIQSFSRGEELLLSGQEPDILLMDIRLPGQDGMKIMEQLRHRGSRSQVIFITAFQKYVFQAFDLEAVHYLLKPVTPKKLFPAMDRAIKRSSLDQDPTILITSGAAATRVRIRDIVYCEAFNHQIALHTMTEEISFSGTLDALEKKLTDSFFRCHRSYLVNMQYVTEKEPGGAILADGSKILIARRKQQTFTRKLLEACRKEAD